MEYKEVSKLEFFTNIASLDVEVKSYKLDSEFYKSEFNTKYYRTKVGYIIGNGFGKSKYYLKG